MEEIKKLAGSPVMGSNEDIENFVRIMELTQDKSDILYQGKEVIKKHYLNQSLTDNDMQIVKEAISIVFTSEEELIESTNAEHTANKLKEFKENPLAKLKDELMDESLTYLDKIIKIANAYRNNIIDKKTVYSLSPEYIDKTFPDDIFTIDKIVNLNNSEDVEKLSLIRVSKMSDDEIRKKFYDHTPLEQLIILAKNIVSREDIYEIWHLLILRLLSRKDVLYLYNLLFKDEGLDLGEFAYLGEYVAPTTEEILTIAHRHIRKDIYINPNVPTKKRQNFKNAIDYTIEEEILVFVDLTFFGKGDNAIAITSKGVYQHNSLFGALSTSNFFKWEEFFSNPFINKDHFIMTAGDMVFLSSGDSSVSQEELASLFKELYTLAMTHHKREIKEVIDMKPDIDTNKALHSPYTTLKHLIAMKFLYASPAYRLYRYLIENDLTGTEDDTFLSRLYQLSNKHEIERMIINAEKTYTNLLLGAIQSTNDDSVNLLGKSGDSIFKINEKDINTLNSVIQNNRSIIYPKLNEIYNSAQSLKHLSAQTNDNGSALKMAVPKLGLAVVSAYAGNPMGAITAISAFKDISNSNTQANQKKSREQILLEDWGGVYSLLYGSYLADYYKQFKTLSYQIAKQFIASYKQIQEISTQDNKLNEYKQYLKKELIFMIEDIDHIEMRRKLREIEEMQNKLQEV